MSDLTPAEERECIRRAQKGDRSAYERIHLAHRERAFASALAIVKNYDDARDLSQDAFVRAYKALSNFQEGRPFFPWYYRILRNLCMTYLKKHGSGRQTSLDQIIEDTGRDFPSEEMDTREAIDLRRNLERMAEEMDRLKPEFSEILKMFHLDGMDYKEIALALKIPKGTVMSRLYHARAALAKAMAKYKSL